jgi:hypothetical protein
MKSIMKLSMKSIGYCQNYLKYEGIPEGLGYSKKARVHMYMVYN